MSTWNHGFLFFFLFLLGLGCGRAIDRNDNSGLVQYEAGLVFVGYDAKITDFSLDDLVNDYIYEFSEGMDDGRIQFFSASRNGRKAKVPTLEKAVRVANPQMTDKERKDMVKNLKSLAHYAESSKFKNRDTVAQVQGFDANGRPVKGVGLSGNVKSRKINPEDPYKGDGWNNQPMGLLNPNAQRRCRHAIGNCGEHLAVAKMKQRGATGPIHRNVAVQHATQENSPEYLKVYRPVAPCDTCKQFPLGKSATDHPIFENVRIIVPINVDRYSDQ